MRRSSPLVLIAIGVLLAVEAGRRGVSLTKPLALLWLVVGIGHGLFDGILAARIWRISIGRATTLYGLAAVVSATFAVFVPVGALGLHAMVSAQHFGQAEWGENSANSRGRQLGIFLWGMALVAVMILGPWSASRELLGILLCAPASPILAALETRRGVLLVIAGTFAAVTAFVLGWREETARGGPLARTLETALLHGLFLVAPLWVAFPVYLSLWHGMGAWLEDVAPILEDAWGCRTPRTGIVLATAATVVATLGALYFALFARVNLASLPWFVGPGAFAFLMAVTVPHAFVMSGVVRNRRKALRASEATQAILRGS